MKFFIICLLVKILFLFFVFNVVVVVSLLKVKECKVGFLTECFKIWIRVGFFLLKLIVGFLFGNLIRFVDDNGLELEEDFRVFNNVNNCCRILRRDFREESFFFGFIVSFFLILCCGFFDCFVFGMF